MDPYLAALREFERMQRMLDDALGGRLQRDLQERAKRDSEWLSRMTSHFRLSQQMLAEQRLATEMSRLNDMQRQCSEMAALDRLAARLNDFEEASASVRLQQALDQISSPSRMVDVIGRSKVADAIATLTSSADFHALQSMVDVTRQAAERMAELAGPFESIAHVLDRGDSIAKLFAKQFGNSSLEALARIPTLRRDRARRMAEQLDASAIERLMHRLEALEHAQTEDAASARSQFYIGLIIGLLLAVLPLWWSLHEADKSEERLTGEIRKQGDRAASKEQVKALEELLKRLLAESTSSAEVQYAVKARDTPVRIAPRHGARVVSIIYPNQIVTMTAEDRQWIAITWYDLLTADLTPYFSTTDSLNFVGSGVLTRVRCA